jgi:xanthine/CO dehydrogenase XdhC/CoxF family maturation factor
MKDFKAVVTAYRKIDFAQRKAALATVVRVHGSSYRSPGARMLITDDGRWTGSISGGCLEGDALRKARQVMNDGKALTITYDTREESNQNLGISLGCNGVIDVLFEKIDPADKENPILFFEKIIDHATPLALATVFSSQHIGKKWLVDSDNKKITGQEISEESVSLHLRSLFTTKKSETRTLFIQGTEADVFFEFIQPGISVMIFGGGFDARPVSQLAKSLGWNVHVTDECVAHIAPAFFPEADKLSLCHRDFIDRDFAITPYTACVLMSHNYEYDRDVLRKILKTETPYIGILGPRKRFDKIQEEFLKEGIVLSDHDLHRIHSPIGLDIGAEAPDEISVSIVAEIQSKFAHRKGGFLKDLSGPIHERSSHSDEVLKKSY